MTARNQPRDRAIDPVRWPTETELVRSLFREYQEAIGIDLCFQGFDRELANLPGDYLPPDGGLWLARVDGEVAGVVGLRPFGFGGRAQGVCEMKRLWLRPAYRGLGLGRRLAETALAAARARAYRRMRLDTLPDMETARALYASLGFRDVTGETADPHPGLIYMVLDFAAAGYGEGVCGRSSPEEGGE